MADKATGRCYVVPTPIGNLEDITLRALSVLREVDLIYAEDTRTTGKLLKHFEIKTPMRSFHAFNEHQVLNRIVADLDTGLQIALVSDAGTPGISDPGLILMRQLAAQGHHISCLPGATALVPAIVMSGLPSDQFYFEGFLPHKKGRETRLKELAQRESTFIIYESPHRLERLLTELALHMGSDRQAAVVREVSKIHEQCARGTIAQLQQMIVDGSLPVKGEIVVVVAARPKLKKNKYPSSDPVKNSE